ncbi:hypothetical protein LCGC14_1205480 [marine sediment metagenome]|uniref:Alcohol dehydrogenase iron-type/glycerol dehydrogenase GldA domain-containing protein n=1 Tax=marine sediment metagenome TaxID=412755 RepID=A0A0F9M312_9ZZZZ
MFFFHFDGVTLNPTTNNINAGVDMGELNNVDVILGVGGGSSIDVAKCISVGIMGDIAKNTFHLPDYANHGIVPTAKDVMDLLKNFRRRYPLHLSSCFLNLKRSPRKYVINSQKRGIQSQLHLMQ